MADEITKFSDDERLFHYTSADGLYGILNSRCIWATHYQFLNDTSEFQAANASIEDFLSRELLKVLAAEKVNGLLIDPTQDLRLRAREEARSHLSVLRQAAFNCVDSFVFSAFSCRRSQGRPFNDGVYQHWSNYGRSGGYALQLNPDVMTKLAIREGETFVHSGLFLERVSYSNDSTVPTSLSSDYSALGAASCAVSSQLHRGEHPSEVVVRDTYLPFAKIVSLVKDDYFALEAEARVVWFRPKLKGVEPAMVSKVHKVYTRQNGATSIPYVKLFADAFIDETNPIERIIVGPHADNERRANALVLFLESRQLDIEVYVSKVPYLP